MTKEKFTLKAKEVLLNVDLIDNTIPLFDSEDFYDYEISDGSGSMMLTEFLDGFYELLFEPLESEEKEMDEEENILKIINPGEDVNPCYGLEEIELQTEHIKALLEGKQIYTTINCGEYAIIVKTNSRESSETVTEFSDRCRECGAKYGKLLEEKSEVLDKIRAEIGELDGRFVIGDHENYYVRFWDVLSIIDKYKSEKEE